MKAKIEGVSFEKEYENKHDGSKLYGFKITYSNGKKGFYSSKKRDQNKFVVNEECEFEEISMKSNEKTWVKLKPIYAGKPGASNFHRAVKKEQSKYSGFAMSYAKDLVVAGKIDFDDMFKEAEMMIDWMVQKDKEIG